MPLTFAQPLPVGNAVNLNLTAPTGAINWCVLRNTTGTFSGYNDPSALVVINGTDLSGVDSSSLVNGTTYYYGMFWYDGSAWHADNVLPATPAATFVQIGADPLSLVRDRLDAGLLVLIGRGTIYHPNNHIQVLTAPPLEETIQWPVVTVHLQSDQTADQAVGAQSQNMTIGTDGNDSSSGLLMNAQILIATWSLNPDERIALRKAIKGLLVANFPVFDAAGMSQFQISQSDTEDFQTYSAPIYQCMTTFTSLSQTAITSSADDAIQSSITSSATVL